MAVEFHTLTLKHDRKKKHILHVSGQGTEQYNGSTWKTTAALYEFHNLPGGVVIMNERTPVQVLPDLEAIPAWLKARHPTAILST